MKLKLKLPRWLIEATGHLYLHKYPMFMVYRPDIHRVRGGDVRKILDVVEPGDILLRRFDQYINTIFTPGFWGHAGVYIGANLMVHSMSQGCIAEDILNFCRADAVSVLAPKRIGPQVISRAKLLAQINAPYDYEFSSTNDAYYCTEAVDFIHDHTFIADYVMKAGNSV